MPGFITHYICGEAVLNRLPEETQENIAVYRQLYNIGTQGPDIYFYYLPGLLKKRVRNLGSDMHRNNFRIFSAGVLEAMERSHNPNLIFAYFAGFLTHYALDSAAHPYVYYKSGFKTVGDRRRKLTYSVRHRNFETAIDILMLKLMSGEKPADKKLWQLIRAEHTDAMEISKAMRPAIEAAYGRQISHRDVYRAMKYTVNLTRILQSRNGKRKRLMEFAEEMTVGEHVVSSLIHAQEVSGEADYLNLHKTPWHLPWDGKNQVDHSFTELFNKAVAEAENLIVKMDEFKNGNLSAESLLAAIGNKSLSSGVDADEDVEFLFHEGAFA